MNANMPKPTGKIVINLPGPAPSLKRHVWILRSDTSVIVFRVSGSSILGDQYGRFGSEKESSDSYVWANEVFYEVLKVISQ